MLILASASPRRRKIMEKLGLNFKCLPENIDETLPNNIELSKSAEYLAIKKAEACLNKHNCDTVIGSDTVVVADGVILGKPKDRYDAARMLKMLSGKEHIVYTGVAIANSTKKVSFTSSVTVAFDELSDSDIEWYISTGEPMDKAGAYAVQGLACRFIKGINGDFYSVMGLPAQRLFRELNDFDMGDYKCSQEISE